MNNNLKIILVVSLSFVFENLKASDTLIIRRTSRVNFPYISRFADYSSVNLDTIYEVTVNETTGRLQKIVEFDLKDSISFEYTYSFEGLLTTIIYRDVKESESINILLNSYGRMKYYKKFTSDKMINFYCNSNYITLYSEKHLLANSKERRRLFHRRIPKYSQDDVFFLYSKLARILGSIESIKLESMELH
jgi:hypothetical protein